MYFEKELFDKIKNNTITSEEILSLKNSEQRAVIIQTLGYEKIFNSLKNKKLISVKKEYFNNEKSKPVKYELFNVVIDDVDLNMLKVGWYEKGRFRETILGIPKDIVEVDEARAWTFGMSKEEYFNDKLKFRQGDVLVVYKDKQGGLRNEA